MHENLRQMILSVVSEVFETMFFIILEPMEDQGGSEIRKENGKEEVPGENPSPTFIKGEIGFHGDHCGKINLLLPQTLAKRMAGNFLGMEEDEVSQSQTLDMAGEVTNMISGNLFSRLDKKDGCKITVPKIEVISGLEAEEQDQSFPKTIIADFCGEGQKIRVKVHFDN